jgi:hypothetical protein
MCRSAIRAGSLALALLGACGKSETSAEPISRSALPAELAERFCESLERCCAANEHRFDSAQCRTEYEARFERAFAGDYDPFRVSFDAQAAGDCLAELTAELQCGQLPDRIDPTSACERLFVGELAAGEACERSVECRGRGAFCDGEVLECVAPAAGEPIPVERGELGDACTDDCPDLELEPGGECVVLLPAEQAPGELPVFCYQSDGLYCGYDGSSRVCLRRLGEGGDCSNDPAVCEHPLFCDFAEGACASPRADGKPCSSGQHCQSGFCRNERCGAEPSESECASQAAN